LRTNVMFPEAEAMEIDESKVKDTGTKIINGTLDSVDAAVYTPTAALSLRKYLMKIMLTFRNNV